MTGTVSVRLLPAPSSTRDTKELPLDAESPDALEFIGFGPQAANTIYSGFINRLDPNNDPDSLLDYILGHVDSIIGPDDDLDMPEAASRVGLTQKVQDTLTDPRFASMAATELPGFWIKDTLRINYLTMIKLQSRRQKVAESTGSEPVVSEE